MIEPHWFDALQRRFGSWTIPGLVNFIVGMNAAVWALSLLKPEFPSVLALDPHRVMQGEWWRIFTFLFIPPASSPLWMFLWLYLLYTYASALEREWGDFRFNLYYAIGAASTAAASLGLGQGLSNAPLNASIFLAFAALYPDFELLLFFILPVKAKWLAALAWIGIAWSAIFGHWAVRVALSAGLVNYALFFGKDHALSLRYRWRRWRER